MTLRAQLNKIKRTSKVESNESATCMALVQPILKELGWDIADTNQVAPQYPTGGGGLVDYSLNIPNSNRRIYIEAKPQSKNLNDKDVEQVVKYAMQDTTKIVTLTNGIVWWMYLPFYAKHDDVKLPEKRFVELNIKKDSIEKLINEFKTFLSFDALVDGTKVERYAMEVLEARREINELTKKFPEIWQNLLKEPPSELIELIEKSVNNSTGLSPTKEQVSCFLSAQTSTQADLSQTSTKINAVPIKKDKATTAKGSKSPITIIILGKQLSVNSNREIWKSVVEDLYSRQPQKFSSIVGKPHGKKSYIEVGNSQLKVPYQIKTTNYWIELAGSADGLKRRSENLLRLFGFNENDLMIFDSSYVQKNPKIKKSTKKVQNLDRPVAITLLGAKHSVRNWKDVWEEVATILYKKHIDIFTQVVGMPNSKRRSYIELSKNSMYKPRRIENSKYWIETHAGAKALQSRCYYLLELFGYPETELKIHF